MKTAKAKTETLAQSARRRYQCPTCKAAPGLACTDRRGKRISAVHFFRRCIAARDLRYPERKLPERKLP